MILNWVKLKLEVTVTFHMASPANCITLRVRLQWMSCCWHIMTIVVRHGSWQQGMLNRVLPCGMRTYLSIIILMDLNAVVNNDWGSLGLLWIWAQASSLTMPEVIVLCVSLYSQQSKRKLLVGAIEMAWAGIGVLAVQSWLPELDPWDPKQIGWGRSLLSTQWFR